MVNNPLAMPYFLGGLALGGCHSHYKTAKLLTLKFQGPFIGPIGCHTYVHHGVFDVLAIAILVRVLLVKKSGIGIIV